MNGEMYQICCIVSAAKKALREDASIHYSLSKYENKIEFHFLPEKQVFGRAVYTAENVPQWFEFCKRKKLQDVKFICPVAGIDQNVLGFSNTTESAILCFYEDGHVAFFAPDWQYDSLQSKWNIFYTEYAWSNPPAEKPRFENNTRSFKNVLEEISNLAVRINCDNFASIFQKALGVLNGLEDAPDPARGPLPPPVPAEHMRIFKAAGIADVFGGMGSWNDSPPYMAHEKGLDTEYKTLSEELLKNIRLAVLYATNEW